MTIDTSKKHRLRGYPESEVLGPLRDDETGKLFGWYREKPEDGWKAIRWRGDGRFHGDVFRHPLDLIPVPQTVKSEGFWLAVEADEVGSVSTWGSRDAAEATANVGPEADPDRPQGAIEYFPPREYEAGSIIDPREEG